MNTNPIKVFLDSSVIIAGLASATGASHKVLALAELKLIRPYVSEDVISEVLRNAQKKLPDSLAHFYMLFKILPFRIVDPTVKDLEHAKTLINNKDAPILAAAMAGQADWLLSLDKHFLAAGLQEKAGFAIGPPGKFLLECF
ncbi:MAG TPA: putative toxin-antitoxin system toxin component, PIN family [Bacillota bacterium]|nr:putative toxin-antitoxin system toxin component, PIN family [Bacillota bacterium]